MESNTPTNFITVPRSKLYDLVWSNSVHDVTTDLGFSDVPVAVAVAGDYGAVSATEPAVISL